MATLAAAAIRGGGAGQDDGACWGKEERGENGGVDCEGGGEKESAEAHWNERIAEAANAESGGSEGLKDRRRKRLPGWPPGQSAAEGKEATSLLRQLILEQLEENPAECLASWSQTVRAPGTCEHRTSLELPQKRRLA